MRRPLKPTRAQLLRRGRRERFPDVIAPRLQVLFCGINPGLYSPATGHHFARPGNRCSPALHGAGFSSSAARTLGGARAAALPVVESRISSHAQRLAPMS